jgi:hypothetical protein
MGAPSSRHDARLDGLVTFSRFRGRGNHRFHETTAYSGAALLEISKCIMREFHIPQQTGGRQLAEAWRGDHGGSSGDHAEVMVDHAELIIGGSLLIFE